MLVAHILLIEDDPLVAKALTRLLSRFGTAVAAASVREACAALDERRDWTMIVDIGLPDGDGLDVLRHAREIGCNGAALVLSGKYSPECINRAFDLGAHYVVKPFDPDRITAFARDATTPLGDAETGTVREWTARYQLTRVQAAILEATIDGSTRDELIHERGIAEGTLKKHVQNLLRKTGDASLLAASARLLRERTQKSGRR